MNMKVHLLRTSYEACRITRWTKEKGVRWHPSFWHKGQCRHKLTELFYNAINVPKYYISFR